jgi:hypothetical protein
LHFRQIESIPFCQGKLDKNCNNVIHIFIQQVFVKGLIFSDTTERLNVKNMEISRTSILLEDSNLQNKGTTLYNTK